MQTTSSIAPTAAEAQVRNGYLRTIGRVTGREYEIEIWFAVDPEQPQRLFLLSGGRDRSNWVKNLRRQPALRFRIGDRVWSGSGHELIPSDPHDARARDLVCAKYYGDASAQEAQDFHDRALPVAIELTSVAAGEADA